MMLNLGEQILIEDQQVAKRYKGTNISLTDMRKK